MKHYVLVSCRSESDRRALQAELSTRGLNVGQQTDDTTIYGSQVAMCRDSKPWRFWETQGYLTGNVIDYGCGHEDHGVAAWDPFHRPDAEPLLRQYDVVVCNYVLNVQPADHLITLTCALLCHLCVQKGHVLVAVRNDLTGNSASHRGVQRGKTAEEWAELLRQFFWVEQVTGEGFYGYVCTPMQLETCDHAKGQKP